MEEQPISPQCALVGQHHTCTQKNCTCRCHSLHTVIKFRGATT